MATITLYNRSDTQTVNTVTGYILSSEQSNSSENWLGTNTSSNATLSWDVIILHEDGSETSIGTNIAQITTFSPAGIYSNTWSCPDTQLLLNDAIKIVGHITMASDYTRTFVSNQLGWGRLNSATWTFYAYTDLQHFTVPFSGYHAYCYHGDSTHNTRIEGIDYSLKSNSYSFTIC